MNSVLRDAIDAGLASLERVASTPVEPFGFGSDIWGESDLAQEMREVSGMDRLVLAQSIVRRLDCPRGELPDDPDYGISLRSYLNRGVDASELASIGTKIRSELSKDDRIADLVVRVSLSSDGSELGAAMRVTPIDPRIGGFALTLAVTSATVLIEAISEAA